MEERRGCFDVIADKKAEDAQYMAMNNLDYINEIYSLLGSKFPDLEKELELRKDVRMNLMY